MAIYKILEICDHSSWANPRDREVMVGAFILAKPRHVVVSEGTAEVPAGFSLGIKGELLVDNRVHNTHYPEDICFCGVKLERHPL